MAHGLTSRSVIGSVDSERAANGPVADRGGRDEEVFGGLVPSELAGDAAVAHHEDAIRHRQHLFQFGGGEQHAVARSARRAMSAKISDLALTSIPRLGSSRSSTVGDVNSALAITTFCWLPPLREVIGWFGEATRMARSPICRRTACSARDGRRMGALPRDVPVERGEQHVVGHGQRGHESLALAVLGGEDDACLDAVADACTARAASPPGRRRRWRRRWRPARHSKSSERPAPISP